MFFITTYLLILSQIATLVFGFVRSQQNKKIVQSKKEIKREAKLSQLLTGTRESDISIKTVSVAESEAPNIEEISSDTNSESDSNTLGYFDPPI